MENFLVEAEDLPPKQDKKAVVIIGRFNPPTRGHYKVLELAQKFRKDKKLDSLVVVIVEGKKTSEDKSKNPLTADERIRYMKHSGKANWVTDFLVADNAFAALAEVRKNGYEPIAIGAGSDRVKSYLTMLDKYFLDGEKPIKHMSVPGLDRDADAVDGSSKDDVLNKMKAGEELDLEEASASLARRAAELGYFNEFKNIVGQDKNEAAAKQMYNKIRKAMGVK